jgi:hypothetical protein
MKALLFIAIFPRGATPVNRPGKFQTSVKILPAGLRRAKAFGDGTQAGV